MKTITLAGIGVLALSFSTAHAGEWRVGPGPAGVTGIDDVADLYESNYNNTNTFYQADVDLLLPIGLSVQGTYQWESGVRLDMGLGPFFMITSDPYDDDDADVDLDHTEIPIGVTVGYTFIPSANVSPYVRAGFAYHIVSGDYVEGSTPGLLAAAGIEFARGNFASFAFEVAVDKSEVEFERYRRTPTLVRDFVELNTYDVVISFLVKF